MANNYTQTSFYFHCGNSTVATTVAEWINGVKADDYPEDLRQLMVDQTGEETFADGELQYTIAEAELDSAGGDQVWIHIDEGGDLELLAVVLSYAMNRYPEVENGQGFQWAETCSKPRVDEFGGGACFIARGKGVIWMHAAQWLGEQGNRP